MKAFIHLALVTILATEAVAYSSHGHLHRHLKVRADTRVETAPSSSSKPDESEKNHNDIKETTVIGDDKSLTEARLKELVCKEGFRQKTKFVNKPKDDKGKNMGDNKERTEVEEVPEEFGRDEVSKGHKSIIGQTVGLKSKGIVYYLDRKALLEGEIKLLDPNTAQVQNPNLGASGDQMLPPNANDLLSVDYDQLCANYKGISTERVKTEKENSREPSNQGGSEHGKPLETVPHRTEKMVSPAPQDDTDAKEKTSPVQKKPEEKSVDVQKKPEKKPLGVQEKHHEVTFVQNSSSIVKTVTHRNEKTNEVQTYKFTYGPSPIFHGNLKSIPEELEKPFPNNTLPCSQFPTGYGAQPVTWLKESPEGYSSVQELSKPAGWTWWLNQTTDYEIYGGNGNCKPNSFCAYACPPGYERTQWPALQPKIGQSVGGLYCSADSKLLVTRPEVKTLCKATEQNLVLVNEMKDLGITLCCTVYPGNENMVIPIVAGPESSTVVTNPPNWEFLKYNLATGKNDTTSKHCYVQPAGLSMVDGCQWRSTRNPMISADVSVLVFGTSITQKGVTHFSVGQNIPKGPLDFATNIHVELEIVGEKKTGCFYAGRGTFPNAKGDNFCSVAAKKGQKGIIRVKGPFPMEGNPEKNPFYFGP